MVGGLPNILGGVHFLPTLSAFAPQDVLGAPLSLGSLLLAWSLLCCGTGPGWGGFGHKQARKSQAWDLKEAPWLKSGSRLACEAEFSDSP
jgi:hypothetical protein